MGMKMEDGAAQATLALLKTAKELANAVVGDADQATVRAVFDRLCMEIDIRVGEVSAPDASTVH